MQAIHETKLLELIKSTKGKFFTITFTKKALAGEVGETRRLTGRTGVKKGVQGILGRKDSANNTNAYTKVWCTKKMNFRMVNLSTTSKVQFKGETYIVVR
jgi:hypothetical protein